MFLYKSSHKFSIANMKAFSLKQTSRSMRERAIPIIPFYSHGIEVSEGVSIFVKEREVKILTFYRIRMVAGGDLLGG